MSYHQKQSTTNQKSSYIIRHRLLVFLTATKQMPRDKVRNMLFFFFFFLWLVTSWCLLIKTSLLHILPRQIRMRFHYACSFYYIDVVKTTKTKRVVRIQFYKPVTFCYYGHIISAWPVFLLSFAIAFRKCWHVEVNRLIWLKGTFRQMGKEKACQSEPTQFWKFCT